MFRAHKLALAAAIALGGIAVQSVGASAMPLVDAAPATLAHTIEGPAAIQAYWHHGWHRHWGYHRHWGWRRHWGWHRHHHWGWRRHW
jgi:hypothetical protein